MNGERCITPLSPDGSISVPFSSRPLKPLGGKRKRRLFHVRLGSDPSLPGCWNRLQWDRFAVEGERR